MMVSWRLPWKPPPTQSEILAGTKATKVHSNKPINMFNDDGDDSVEGSIA
jgi:hypothetical protein